MASKVEGNALPTPPKHLSDESRELWREIVQTFILERHQLRLLRLACESYDLAQQARELLAKEGLTIKDRYGVVKPHPAAAIARDARISYARLIRELALSDDDEDGAPRPPALGGYK